ARRGEQPARAKRSQARTEPAAGRGAHGPPACCPRDGVGGRGKRLGRHGFHVGMPFAFEGHAPPGWPGHEQRPPSDRPPACRPASLPRTNMNRRLVLKQLTAATVLACAGWMPQVASAQDTIKVGILHSLSGTMAISETSLKDVALMTIEEINANGGVLGKKLEPVVVDPASNWPLFAERARQLLSQDKVAVVFGCWTSVSRKSVLPVFKELNSLLFYPVQYEG